MPASQERPPMFAHRRYEALAKVLGQTKPSETEFISVEHVQWALMVKEITKLFVQDNPRFDMERFLKAVADEAKKANGG